MLTGIRFRPFPEQKRGLFIAASLGTKTVVESRTAAAVVKHDPIKKRGVAKCDTLTDKFVQNSHYFNLDKKVRVLLMVKKV